MINLLSYFRSLSFGGILGSIIAYILFIRYPNIFSSMFSTREVILIGASIGAAIHRLIDTLIIKTFLYPISNFISYYFALIQLTKLGPIIGAETQKQIIEARSKAYFLGERHEKKELQSPQEMVRNRRKKSDTKAADNIQRKLIIPGSELIYPDLADTEKTSPQKRKRVKE